MAFKPLLLSLGLAFSTLAAEPDAGFEPIFDGTLKHWEGDPTYWRAENGVLIGEVKPETLLKKNSFIIWRGGELADFELKLEYRVSDQGNSGINYRSIQVPDPETKWAMQGYQADIDGQERNRPPLRHTGQNYEERGRTFLARRGEMVRVDATGKGDLRRAAPGRPQRVLGQHPHRPERANTHAVGVRPLLAHAHEPGVPAVGSRDRAKEPAASLGR